MDYNKLKKNLEEIFIRAITSNLESEQIDEETAEDATLDFTEYFDNKSEEELEALTQSFPSLEEIKEKVVDFVEQYPFAEELIDFIDSYESESQIKDRLNIMSQQLKVGNVDTALSVGDH